MSVLSSQQLNTKLIRQATISKWVTMDYEKTGYDGKYIDEPSDGFDIILNEELTDDALAMAKAALRLCEQKAIVFHLARLSVHKKVNGASSSSMNIIFEDYAKSLCKFSEMAIIDAITEIMENSENAFFPQLATILKFTKKHQNKWQDYHDTLVGYLNKQTRLEKPKHTQPKEEDMHNRPQFKANWKPHHWQEWVDEAKETAEILRKMGLEDSAIGWDKIAEERILAKKD